jgi:hypothetical protein
MVGVCRICGYILARKFRPGYPWTVPDSAPAAAPAAPVADAAPPTKPPSPKVGRGLSVAALVAVVAALELILNRVVSRLVRVDFLLPRSGFTRALDVSGLFLFELLSSLAIFTLAAGLVRACIRTDEFRRAARASFPLIGAVFIALAAMGVVFRLPPPLAFHLQLSYLFLTLLFALAAVAGRAPGRAKLGAVVLWVGVVLRLAPQLAARLPLSVELVPAAAAAVDLAALAAITVGGGLLVPTRPIRRSAALTIGIVTTLVVVVLAVAMRLDADTTRRVIAYGLGVVVPMTFWGQLLLLGAIGAPLFSGLRLVGVGGVHELRGIGLLLVGLGGLALELPAQLATSALGFLCLAASMVRPDGPRLSRATFETIVRAAAAAMGAREVTLSGPDGDDVARLYSPATEAGAPVTARVDRQGGAVRDVEITVGETPPREPPFAIVRLGARHLGPVPADARVATEDPAFDGAFEVYDRRGVGAPLLDGETRAAAAGLVDGWLGVWPQRGLRYHAERLPDGDDGLARLVTLLRALHARTLS